MLPGAVMELMSSMSGRVICVLVLARSLKTSGMQLELETQ